MKITIAMISAAVLAAVAVAGCTGSGARPAAVPTVTKTRPITTPGPTVTMTTPGPTVTITTPGPTRTIIRPGPTVTRTVNRPSPEPPGGGSAGPASGANQIIVRFSGTGTQNTADFTTPSRWHLSWKYWGCPAGASNFIVNEYNTDGSLDINGISVNELGTGRGPVATHAYGDAGTHYLSVNTEGCHWSLVPVTG
jgi:hypothetical protein